MDFNNLKSFVTKPKYIIATGLDQIGSKQYQAELYLLMKP